MFLDDYSVWQSCLLVPGISRAECASWVQAWGSIAALAIAIGLQVRTSKERIREGYRTKFDAINSAIVLCGSIANAALALKRQHALPACDHLQESKKRLSEHKAANAAVDEAERKPFRLQMHLMQMPMLTLPVDLLLDLIVLRVATNGRACAAMCELQNSYQSLRTAIARRNEVLVQMFNGGTPENLHAYYFLGEPQPGEQQRVNQELPDLSDAILEYTNQVAFFGAYICDELRAHGDAIRSQCGAGVPMTATVDFSGPRGNGLMPPSEDFGRWLQGFSAASRPRKRGPWYRRFRPGSTTT